LTKSNWHRDVIENLGLQHIRWPKVLKQGDVVGHIRVGTKDLPCYTPVGDFQAAVLGTLLAPDELSLNIATGAQVSRLSRQLTLGEYQTRPFFDDQFINTFTEVPGGTSLDVLIGLLEERGNIDERSATWAFVEKAVSSVAETDLEVTFFDAATDTGGSISNIRPDNFTTGHLFRAAFARMAQEYHARALELFPEERWSRLVFSGGLAARLKALRQSVVKRFESSFRLSPFLDDALFGLLILAGVFSGRFQSTKAAVQELGGILQRQSAPGMEESLDMIP
jgi:hypothetical protein